MAVKTAKKPVTTGQTPTAKIALQTEENPPYWTKMPCWVCKTKNWWWRKPRMIFGVFYSPGGWVCGTCHPDPNAEERRQADGGEISESRDPEH